MNVNDNAIHVSVHPEAGEAGFQEFRGYVLLAPLRLASYQTNSTYGLSKPHIEPRCTEDLLSQPKRC